MRMGRCFGTATVLAVAFTILGGAPAHAAPEGTLVAPYESASSWPHCSSQPTEPPCPADADADVDGNLRVEASAESSEPYSDDEAYSSALVVAAHQIESDVQSATFTVHVHVSEAYETWNVDSGCFDDDYDCGAWADTSLSLSASAQHSTCASCSDPTPEFSNGWGAGTDVSLTMVVRNHAGGTVPAGTIRISVWMSAYAHTRTEGSSCGQRLAGVCIAPVSASAKGASQVMSIDYATEGPKTPNQPPTASFTHWCWGGTWDTGAPTTCGYDATGSSDLDGQIVEYNWDFGDGSTSIGGSYPRTYRGYSRDWNDPSQRYVVTLTVVDDTGAIDTESHEVIPNPPNQLPTAQFTASCANSVCTFDPAASSDPDGQITRHVWDFGDGSGASGGTTPRQHTYADGSKTYVVTLTVQDDRYGTDTESKTVTPHPNQAPTARFTTSCNGKVCTFDARSSSDPDGQVRTYSWTYGDGSSFFGGPTVQHSYPEGSASYVVTLTVTDDRGGTDTESLAVKCTRKNQSKPTTCR
jgi:hypothetical protein